jgi:hypothetical protein
VELWGNGKSLEVWFKRPIYPDMKDDPDQIIGKTVRLPASVWAKIDEYRFDNRINKQTDAIRRLIERALEMETNK